VLGLALATSLPELATSVAAVRMGALDLAVGNLYGSNAINMSLLVWLDALYVDAPLLETVDVSNAAAGLIAILLMMFGLMTMVLRAERRRFPVDPTAALILAGYALGALLVWSISEQ
jgi:cation:H+ antiporter